MEELFFLSYTILILGEGDKWGQEGSGERGKKVNGSAHTMTAARFLYMAMLSSVKRFPILFWGIS